MTSSDAPRKSCEKFLEDAFRELDVSPEMQQLLMSKALLLTSLYMHFFIEKNKKIVWFDANNFY